MALRLGAGTLVVAIGIVLITPGSAQDKRSNNVQKKTDSQNAPAGPFIPVPHEPKASQKSQSPTSTETTDGPEHSVRVSGPITIKSGKDPWDKSLVVLTGALVAVGFLQIVFLWRTVVATSNNAKAAKLAAEAVISSERPWMTASAVERAPVLLYIPEAGDPIVYSQGRNVFGVKFSSVGRTPARVIRSAVEYVKIESLSQLPDEPQFSEITTYNGLVLIPGGEPFGFIAFLKPKPMLSKTEVRAIAVREAFVYAYGFVEYVCVFKCSECPHVLRFGYVYNFPQGGEPPALTGFMPGGPPAYNQST